MNKAQGAFSLLELFISIALVMFIGCMMIPKMVTVPDQALRQALDQFETLFYCLQQRALAGGYNQILLFDLEKQAYSYQTMHGKKHTVALPQDLYFDVVPGTYGPPWQAIAPVTKPITFEGVKGTYCVKFFSDGKISSGTLYLCDRNKTVGGALTCAVSQVFYIRRYLYSNRQWKLIKSQ